jgi:hypothetical protein
MKTISNILKGGVVMAALLSVTFCAKDPAGNGGANGGAPVEITERANSFVVKSGSYVAFTPCIGNSEANAEMTAAGLVWQDNKSMVESVEAKDGKIVVKLADGKEGNAVVCALNGADTTWSWNLWVTDAIISDVTVNDSLTVMDRNIGALAAEGFNEKTVGNIYQWGRKDPWPGAGYGNFLRKMYDINGNEINRGHVKLADDCVNNVAGAIAAPNTVFYRKWESGVTNNGNYSWVTNKYNAPEIANADSLWNNNFKSIYDPCPAGYQVAYSYTARDIAANVTAENPAVMLMDETYKVPESVSDAWQETYVVQYGKQVQFRGGQYGNLKFMVTGEITHEMKFSTNAYVGGLMPVGRYWTSKIDPNFKTSNSYFRAIAMVQNASWNRTQGALLMNTITTSYLNLAYQLPVRCVKERK